MARRANRAGLTLFILKIIAILSMLASHVLVVFEAGFPYDIKLGLYYFGRLAFPIFAFSIANGWNKTHSRLLYMLRILIMAVISQIPFAIALRGVTFIGLYSTFFSKTWNIGFTFLLAAICLLIYDMLRKIDFPKVIALVCAILPALAFEFLTPFHVEYGYAGVALILVMYAFIDDLPLFFFSSSAVLVFMNASFSNFILTVRADVFLAQFTAILLLLLYNGNRGSGAKYLFYIFYPLHIIILYLLKLYVI